MGILRVLLALAVVMAHTEGLYGLYLTGGPLAVEIFFIISGFYMTMILEQKYAGKNGVLLFWSNRALRLYPIYLTVLAVSVGACLLSFALFGNWGKIEPYIAYRANLHWLSYLYLIATNIFIFGQDTLMFMGLNRDTGTFYFTPDFTETDPHLFSFLFIPQAWTLGIELSFYVIAPFIVKRSTLFIAGLASLSILAKILTFTVMKWHHDPWTYRFFPSELCLFLFGSLSYRLYVTDKIKKICCGNLKYHLSAGYLALIFAYQFIAIPSTTLPYIKEWVILSATIFAIPFLFDWSKSNKFDNRLGELSYPIYISHMLVIFSATLLLKKYSPTLYEHRSILCILATMCLSYVLVVLVSDPMERLRRRRTNAYLATRSPAVEPSLVSQKRLAGT